MRGSFAPALDVPSRRADLTAGLGRLADPKISLASFAAMLLGTALASAAGPVHGGWLLVTLLAVFAVEVAKNASGEVFDFDSGADLAVRPEDRSPFSGGKRVLVDRVLTRGQTIGIAAAGYAAAIALGLLIAAFREPAVIGLGVSGVALAYFYHAPPFRLAYRGFGETAVALCYGPLIVGGTYLVQRGTLPLGVLAIAAPLGLLIAAFLIANEFPDVAADHAAGKRTLVVRLGRRRAGRLFAECVVLAFALLLILPAFGVTHWIWLGLVAAVPAHAAALRLLEGPVEIRRIVPAQRMALLAFVLLALGMSAGAWLAA